MGLRLESFTVARSLLRSAIGVIRSAFHMNLMLTDCILIIIKMCHLCFQEPNFLIFLTESAEI